MYHLRLLGASIPLVWAMRAVAPTSLSLSLCTVHCGARPFPFPQAAGMCMAMLIPQQSYAEDGTILPAEPSKVLPVWCIRRLQVRSAACQAVRAVVCMLY